MSGKMLRRIATRLRRLADRLDNEGAPKGVSWSFTFEEGEGIRFRSDGRGCPLWYYGDSNYRRAHDEADTEHPQVDWATMTTRRSGGSALGPDGILPGLIIRVDRP